MVSFAKNVANFISSIGKDHVVILSSLDSGKRRVIDASRYLKCLATQTPYFGFGCSFKIGPLTRFIMQ